MENHSYGAVRIESAKFGKRGVFFTALGFFASFGLICLVGALGPDVFMVRNGISVLHINRTSQDAKWTGLLTSLAPENQLLWLTAKLQRPLSIERDKSFSYMQNIVVDIWGSNEVYESHTANAEEEDLVHTQKASREVTFDKAADYSNDITIFNFHSLNYENYKVVVSFESPGTLVDDAGGSKIPNGEDAMTAEFDITFVNKEYTEFEIRWKYFFVIMTLVVMFFPRLNRGGVCSKSRAFTSFSLIFEGYFSKLCGTSRAVWSYQQKWITALLILLFLFNDPLIYYEIYNTRVGAEVVGGFYIAQMALFICALMLFWLCALDETRAQGTLQRGAKVGVVRKHGLKVGFVVCFWIYIVTTYCWVRLQQKNDPSYEAAEEGDKYVGATVVLALFLVVYMLWFMFYVCKSLAVIRQLPPPFLFVFVITFFTFVATIVGLFIAAFYPIPSAPLDFLGMYGLYNLYVWTLAFVYAPLNAGFGNGFGSMDSDISEESGMGGDGQGGMMVGGEDAIDDMQL